MEPSLKTETETDYED